MKSRGQGGKHGHQLRGWTRAGAVQVTILRVKAGAALSAPALLTVHTSCLSPDNPMTHLQMQKHGTGKRSHFPKATGIGRTTVYQQSSSSSTYTFNDHLAVTEHRWIQGKTEGQNGRALGCVSWRGPESAMNLPDFQL